MVAQQMKLTVAGVDLEVAVVSERLGTETVLFVHGLGCCKESFASAFQDGRLSPFGLVAVDLPGFGESSRPREFSFAMEDQAAVLHQLLDRLGVRRVHLVAHSMGGAPALLLARRLGDRLVTFVDIEGNLVAEDCSMISRRTARASFERFQRVGLPALRTAARESTEPAMRPFSSWLALADPWAFWRSSISLVRWSDSGELLRTLLELPVPAAYVYGERSVLETVRSQLSGVALLAVARSGHFVMQDAPEEFWPLLERFLGSMAG